MNFMAITNINISIDSELKDKAQSIFDALGLDISTAINMILRKAIYQGETLFGAENTQEKNEDKHSIYLIMPDTSKTPVPGQLKGLIEISPDFYEPLEEMKEYMY